MLSKKKAAPDRNGGGASNGKLGRVSEAEATRVAAFFQAHAAFTPSGLTAMQIARHKLDVITRLRLGLPMRRPGEGDDRP